jgi:hypothetical protein
VAGGRVVAVTSPLTFTVLQTIMERSLIDRAIAPNVLTLCSFSFSFDELTFIYVPIAKFIDSITMLQTFTPLALISVTVWEYMHSMAVCFRFLPFTNI